MKREDARKGKGRDTMEAHFVDSSVGRLVLLLAGGTSLFYTKILVYRLTCFSSLAASFVNAAQCASALASSFFCNINITRRIWGERREK